MSKIDNLYKRAFSSGGHEYDNSNWEKMASLLDESMPVKNSTSWLSKAASFALVAGLTLVGSLFNDTPNGLMISNYIPLASPNSEFALNRNYKKLPINSQSEIEKSNFSNGLKAQTLKSKTLVASAATSYTDEILKTELIPSKNDLASPKLSIVDPKFSSASASINDLAGLSNSNASDNLKLTIEKLGFSIGKRPMSLASRGVIQKESTAAPIRSLASLEFMNRPDLVLDHEPLSLLPHNPMKSKKIKLRASPKLTAGLSIVREQLDNDLDLNIYVSEEIKNVALVNTKNVNTETGVSVGVKWKGLVISSGVSYKQHAAKYRLYYSHTRNWEEQRVQSETSIEIDSSYIVELNDGYTFGFDTIYQIDSNYYTTSDTTRIARSSTDELDEYFGYKLSYANIPLNLGYEHQINRFFVSINVGMNMSFLTGVKGSLYNSETNRVESFSHKQDLNPVLYTANASVGVGYNLSPQLSFTVQPRISKALNSTFKSTSNFATTYTGYGANFALRYSF